MYPVLILRCELVCLVILVFLFFTSRAYNIDNKNRSFHRILFFAFLHVVFDIITVLTVNHLDTVPVWLNWTCHVIFYLSAIFYSNEIVNYVVAICYPRTARKFYALGHILTLVYICCLPFLDIQYIPSVGTYSSAGPAAIAGYGLAFVFFITSLVIIFTHMDMMTASIKSALIPMMLVLMVTEVCQIIWPSVLFTGGAITIVTVGFFFSLENPVTVFRQKAMTDALTGVRSRNSYDEDMEQYDVQFQKSPDNRYTFVFIDLNDLRIVNNRFGHAEGDNYIIMIATAINTCMKHSSTIYRIGGDEFLILYYKVDEIIVGQEIIDLHKACKDVSSGLEYTAAISAGYATSSSNYHSLKDVVKSADYAMYQNKARFKSGKSYDASSLGTKLNYTGLTDSIFEAMCASNERNYPFITNMDTNVTRIAPAWKEYFGLEDEFYADFTSVWKEYIHPDYYKGYMDDLISVINGHRKYHHYDYLARRTNGEYVHISCNGSIYRDVVTGTSYFTGFIINHGLDENTDSVTGLKNFDIITTSFYKHQDDHRPFSLLKLKLNNFARVNMLYGYHEGDSLLRKISEILVDELGDMGQVFCQDSINFSIMFESGDADIVKDYYSRIQSRLSAGLNIEAGTIPIEISGGAYVNNGEACDNGQMRCGLVYSCGESQTVQKNSLVFYQEPDKASTDTDISLLTHIHSDALTDHKYFRLRYQPIIDTESNETVGAEALLRWIHPEYGEIAPGRFIDFLETDPCYYRLGLDILEQAVSDARRFQEKLPRFKVSVNITALQLQNDHFLDDVADILNRHSYDPGLLVLELTERCKEMNTEFLAKKISEFRSRGILIAFDDLGTGYSTISILMDIPVDEIKLDKEFVQDIKNRENYQLFIQALVLGKSAPGYNYNICFEGVETEEMLKEIGRYGSFLVQGYYFSKPLLIDEFISYIEK